MRLYINCLSWETQAVETLRIDFLFISLHKIKNNTEEKMSEINDNNLEKDYLTIKEFAKFVEMSISKLRYYDNIGVFEPTRRGVDFENNYRYYSPEQITIIRMIRVLTDIGVKLNTIKELKENRTPEKIIKLLSKYKDIITNEIHELREIYSIINTFHSLLSEAMNVTETEISVVEMPEKRIILGNVNDYSGTTSFYREYIRFYSEPHKPKLNMSFPIGGYFDSMKVFLKEPSRPTRFFSIDPKGHECKAAGLYLVGYTHGYYGETNDLPQRMKAFAKKNGLVFNGPVYHIFLIDEISVTKPGQIRKYNMAQRREQYSHSNQF